MLKQASEASGSWLALASPAAFIAALFLTFNPYLLWYSQEGKMYTVVVFLALLAVWFWLKGIGRGGWRPWLGANPYNHRRP